MDSRAFLKIVILGDSGVRKTAIMHRCVHRKLYNKYKSTIGADILNKQVEVDNKLVTLQIWDTAGQERFACLDKTYYRGAYCCVLVYDVTKPNTLDSLDKWRNDFLEHADPLRRDTFPFVVIGNKTDLQTNAEKILSVQMWCQGKGNVSYFVTSAETGDMVQEAFKTVGQKALKRKRELHKYAFPNPIQITNKHEESQEGCSCIKF